VGDKVLSHKGNWQDVSAVIFKGVEELFEVTLEDGRSIHCTKEHRFLTNNGWKHLRELSVGDDILTEEELHTRERRLRENNRN
jgi:intein/homing endonuclease